MKNLSTKPDPNFPLKQTNILNIYFIQDTKDVFYTTT